MLLPRIANPTLLAISTLLLVLGIGASGQQRTVESSATQGNGLFVDVTAAKGLDFHYRSSHTSRKYLLETMAPGVALFDYDNDGRLDIFLVNGAPLSDPTSKGTIPQKTGPEYWNRLYH